MAGVPVSVCIIAKNEEGHIGQCLEKIQGYQMEIVVVDTGSTDRTREIAERYTDKVYDFEWIDDFSAARNFAVSKASNNWVLHIDCDEYVEELDVPRLRICMQRYPKCVGAAQIMNVHTTDGKESIQIDEVPRFYNRNHYGYRFKIHEQIIQKDVTDYDQAFLQTFQLPMRIRHHGYDLSQEDMIRKQERNVALLLGCIGEEEQMDDYLYFQLGRSYHVMQRYEEAIKAYDMCLEVNRDPKKRFLSDCLGSYVDCLLETGNAEHAYQLLDLNRAYLRTTRLRYLFGKTAHICQDDTTAIGFLTGITDAEDLDQLGDDVFDAYIRIFAIYKARGDAQAIAHYKEKLAGFGEQHGKKIVFE